MNNTAIATSRTLRAILEHYKQADRTVMIPHKLRKYRGGMEQIEGTINPLKP